MANPLISILVPVKNAALYLADCIDSILDQTEKNWELLIVDDHSTDTSYQLLNDYSKKDSRIQVYKNNGHGIIPALRLAYQHSKGTLITRMDADDRMASNKLEKLKQVLIKFGVGHLSTGLVKYFSTGTLGDGYLKYETWINKLSLKEENYKDIYKECVIPSPCWMVFRQDLEKSNAFEPATYPEDYDLCFRFYKQGLTIKSVGETLHYWRDYPERTSRNDPNYADIHFFDLKINYFLELDYNPKKTLLLWGAGKKGKKIAHLLKSQSIPFRWITNNPRKIGHNIYGCILESEACLETMESFQLVIAVAAPADLAKINNRVDQFNMKNVFYFC